MTSDSPLWDLSNVAKWLHFFVNERKFETDRSSVSGADIKRIAGIDATYQLFLEERSARILPRRGRGRGARFLLGPSDHRERIAVSNGRSA
ncbi:hypothetical protein FXV83_26060 [Bradyrhizobium hipponense]|uniref:Uncharacterized protein n=1 Tax=Bradyrhizobium hipponense TaxID=2605638 RepID=A0A5S4YGX6_9BRAD|nr:hypothetical protein FXV83_26060 [Bradyrhizobium hipponense]